MFVNDALMQYDFGGRRISLEKIELQNAGLSYSFREEDTMITDETGVRRVLSATQEKAIGVGGVQISTGCCRMDNVVDGKNITRDESVTMLSLKVLDSYLLAAANNIRDLESVLQSVLFESAPCTDASGTNIPEPDCELAVVINNLVAKSYELVLLTDELKSRIRL